MESIFRRTRVFEWTKYLNQYNISPDLHPKQNVHCFPFNFRCHFIVHMLLDTHFVSIRVQSYCNIFNFIEFSHSEGHWFNV